MSTPEQPKPIVQACQWMSVGKHGIVECGELPTQQSPGNGKFYCSFHFRYGKDFGPMEKEDATELG